MDCINKTTSFSIQKAAVIGAGTMGAGIAAWSQTPVFPSSF